MNSKDFSRLMFDYMDFSYFSEDDLYYCTFDKVCRTIDPEFYSCERGLHTCLLFDSKHKGMYTLSQES